jgi:hypothetical protein
VERLNNKDKWAYVIEEAEVLEALRGEGMRMFNVFSCSDYTLYYRPGSSGKN